jgi:hypothetical protein
MFERYDHIAVKCNYELCMDELAHEQTGSLNVEQTVLVNDMPRGKQSDTPCQRLTLYRLHEYMGVQPDAQLVTLRVSLNDLTLFWPTLEQAVWWITTVVLQTNVQRVAWNTIMAWYAHIHRSTVHATIQEVHALAL